jgi:hypothetical protein
MSKSDQKFSGRPLTSEAPLKSQTISCGFLLWTKLKRDGLFSEDFWLLLPASFHLCFIYIHKPITDTMHTYVDSIVKDTLKNYHWKRMTSAVHAVAVREETNGRLPLENMKGTVFLVVTCILITSKSFYFTNGCTICLFSRTLKFTLKF